MITDEWLSNEITKIKPGFFDHKGAVEHEYLVHAWSLPAGRVLFACIEHWRYHAETRTIRLHVLDQARGQLKTVGTVTGVNSAELARVCAIEWMQGLRADDLSGFDQSMLDYLGELAWRMSPDQLRAFEGAYFTYNTEDWGTVENPNPVPDERLGELLESQGFSDTYLSMHWQH